MNDLVLLEQELNSEVALIEIEGIREFTLALLSKAPKSFWEGRASRNHHPPDERLPGGNLLHTVRVLRLLGVALECFDLGQITKDIYRSAATVHDLCRYGLDGDSEYTVPAHPHLVRKLAERNNLYCAYSQWILEAVERHMGKWGAVPYSPSVIDFTTLLHLLDTISANAARVWDPLR